MKQKVNFYSDEFKFKVVQEYLNSDLSQLELLKKYSIGGNSCITNWMRKFGLKEGPKRKLKPYPTTMSKGKKKTPEERALEEKVKELEAALKYEKLRSLALDTMIDIAEKNLKISIRKKPGTKQ
jgi:transposase